MKPYYDHGGIAIYCADVRELVTRIELSDVGCVIADPPYAETACAWDRW